MPASSSKTKKSRPPKLYIMFDTNILYETSFAEVFNKDIIECVEKNAKKDISIEYAIPEVVRHERQYQMIQQAKKSIPVVKEIETVLGCSTIITEEILNDRIEKNITELLKSLNILEIESPVDEIEWKTVINNACYRNPPFENIAVKIVEGNYKEMIAEKGFRDAVILETFVHYIQDKPKTAQAARLIFFTNDKLLIQAVKERTKENKNVRIIDSIENLNGLVNTLVSKADEQFIENITSDVDSYFFTQENQSCFYYTDVKPQFLSEYSAQLDLDMYSDVTSSWTIFTPPSFIRKVRQRMYWKSKIRIEQEKQDSLPLSYITGRLTDRKGILSGPSSARALFKRNIILYVDWSVSVSVNGRRISKPRVEGFDVDLVSKWHRASNDDDEP